MALQAVPEQITAASREAETLAAKVDAVQLGVVTDRVECALPATQTSTAATELGVAWTALTRQLARDIDSYAVNLQFAALTYDEVDRDTSHCLLRRPGR